MDIVKTTINLIQHEYVNTIHLLLLFQCCQNLHKSIERPILFVGYLSVPEFNQSPIRISIITFWPSTSYIDAEKRSFDSLRHRLDNDRYVVLWFMTAKTVSLHHKIPSFRILDIAFDLS